MVCSLFEGSLLGGFGLQSDAFSFGLLFEYFNDSLDCLVWVEKFRYQRENTLFNLFQVKQVVNICLSQHQLRFYQVHVPLGLGKTVERSGVGVTVERVGCDQC